MILVDSDIARACREGEGIFYFCVSIEVMSPYHAIYQKTEINKKKDLYNEAHIPFPYLCQFFTLRAGDNPHGTTC